MIATEEGQVIKTKLDMAMMTTMLHFLAGLQEQTTEIRQATTAIEKELKARTASQGSRRVGVTRLIGDHSTVFVITKKNIAEFWKVWYSNLATLKFFRGLPVALLGAAAIAKFTSMKQLQGVIVASGLVPSAWAPLLSYAVIVVPILHSEQWRR